MGASRVLSFNDHIGGVVHVCVFVWACIRACVSVCFWTVSTLLFNISLTLTSYFCFRIFSGGEWGWGYTIINLII